MPDSLPQIWEIELEIDGGRSIRRITIWPPFFIAAADAEVKAIKAEFARGARRVRCLRSRFLGHVEGEG